MKPISTLKSYRSASHPTDIINAVLTVVKNPKRHLRGTMYGLNPGNGKIQNKNFSSSQSDAVCACGLGLVRLVTAPGLNAEISRGEASRAMNAAACRLFGKLCFITVSDFIGLRAFRKVARAALADLKKLTA